MSEIGQPDTSDCELTSYAEMVDIAENIGFLVREERRKRRVSARQVGREIGITSATFTRLEKGHSINVDTLVALLKWLGGEGR